MFDWFEYTNFILCKEVGKEAEPEPIVFVRYRANMIYTSDILFEIFSCWIEFPYLGKKISMLIFHNKGLGSRGRDGP